MAAVESAYVAKYRSWGYTNTATDLSEQEQLLCTEGAGAGAGAPA